MQSLAQAVVIGGSVAGMLAARVLADAFASVLVVETDSLSDQPLMRKGVPQSPQPHVLFARGYQILEELFPGIGTSLQSAGAIPIDWAREFHHFSEGAWNQRTEIPSAIVSFTCSRPLLEWAIRQQLAAKTNVTFVDRHRVTGLIASDQQITGVQLTSLNDRQSTQLSATLVVDASGRRSSASKWLASLGFAQPSETVVNPFLGYATRRYQAPQDFQDGWKVMLISQQPPDGTRLGYLARIEQGQWIATLGGYGHDFPAIDDAGFLAFARSLPNPKFYEAIAAAEPISSIYAHRATANRWRHYEKVELPNGFIALGDAVCALCPVYGQGMTISALSSLVLRDWLQSKNPDPNRFQRQLAQSNRFPWMLAVGQDSRFLTTAGRSQSNWFSNLLSGYTRRAIKKTTVNAELNTLFMEVAHLLKSPAALYHPHVLLQVMRNANRENSPIETTK